MISADILRPNLWWVRFGSRFRVMIAGEDELRSVKHIGVVGRVFSYGNGAVLVTAGLIPESSSPEVA